MVGESISGGTRRRFLTVAGAAAAASLAGCLGGGGGGGPTETPTGTPTGTETPTKTPTGTETPSGTLDGTDYPAVDEWLTETTVGGADDTYDGTILDMRGRDTVEVTVGAPGNGGDFAFSPSAVAVDAGSAVHWVWTGKGGAHNVAAEPDEQLGESDYEFLSGMAVEGAGNEFTFTFDEPGIALYHCHPHVSLGMKGAVVVL